MIKYINENIKELAFAVMFAITLFILLNYINHVENHGFNPSDDGVVIAQSWRIINGDIPHVDFISIRPVGSGLLHTIHFSGIFPIMISARWFVFFQFFVIAAILSFLASDIYLKMFNVKLSMLSFSAMFLIIFSLSSLNYNLYPWTTIDAVFWSVIGIPFIFQTNRKILNIVGLIIISFAALSRQNFIFFAGISFLYVFYIHRNKPLSAVTICLSGATPFFIYLIFLISNNALGAFITQMTGRTELFETGVLQFGKRFLLAKSSALNVLVIFISLLLIFRSKKSIKELFIQKGIPALLSFVFSFVIIILTFRHFLLDYSDILGLPFELFYMCFSFGLFSFAIEGRFTIIHKYALISLLLAWTSSISLGDNSPVFSLGMLIMTYFLLAHSVLKAYPNKIFSNIINRNIFLPILAILLFGVTIRSQQNVNYRDLGHSNLVSGLKNSSPEFGDILTNIRTARYYNELAEIFRTLPDATNNTVVIPNNAVFYPIMKTTNPMPLDWLQEDEYIGQEESVMNSMLKIEKERLLTYYILDAVDSKRLHEGFYPVYYEKHILAFYIMSNYEEMIIDSDLFKVYVKK